jgi:hypothetical protein
VQSQRSKCNPEEGSDLMRIKKGFKKEETTDNQGERGSSGISAGSGDSFCHYQDVNFP